jgi:predicted metal-dependent phosphoesterase TrpH
VPGVEITAVENGRDVHLLGYFIDPENTALGGFLERRRSDRLTRVREIVNRLRSLGCTVDEEQLRAAAADRRGRSIGRPQIADALVAAGQARDRNDAFDRLLGKDRPAYVSRVGPAPAEVIEVVAGAGGIVSLAHPGVNGMDEIIPRLADGGLDALEVRHSDHDAETERRYRELAARYGLAVSGGSDFHGESGHRIATLGLVTLPAVDFATLESRVA